MRDTVIAQGMVAATDLELFTLVDDPKDAVAIVTDALGAVTQ